MRLPMEKLRAQPLFSWLPEEGVETFSACFDLEAEEIPAGESRNSGARIGYLLEGEAELEPAGTAAPGTLLGAMPAGGGTGWTAEVRLTARTPVTVVWMNREILTNVCYAACWFHGRFIAEAEKLRKTPGEREC